MKGYILNFIIFICATSVGQNTPIDYNNFDTQTASTMLFEKLNDFRDTITVTGYGKPLTEAWPILKNNRDLLKLKWSQRLYDTVVYPNTLENVRQQKLFHVDRSDWWQLESNKKPFMPEVYPTQNKGRSLKLTENGGYTTHRFETYEDLADHMIMCWESSYMHRCTQRGILLNTFFLEKGYECNTIAATCVLYDQGVVYFFVDFVY